MPRYCGAPCRQRAYEARKALRALDGVTKAWQADLARVGDRLTGPMKQIAQLAHVQKQMVQALQPAIGVAKLMPKFESPPTISVSASRAIAQAMSPAMQAQVAQLRLLQDGIAAQIHPVLDVARLMPTPAVARVLSVSTTVSLASLVSPALGKMRTLDALHKEIREMLQPSVNATRLLATINFSVVRPEELLGDFDRAARDLNPNLADVEELAIDLSEAAVGAGDSRKVEAQALLLLVACPAAVAVISPGAGQVFVGMLASIVDNGIVAAGLAVDAYRELSKVVPDPSVVTWALLLAGLISWFRSGSEPA